MTKKFVAEAVRGPAAYNPPETFCRQIGLITARWAYIEHTVQALIWEAAGLSKEAGRTIVREPRVSVRLGMLSDLIGFRKAAWDEQLFKAVSAECEALNQRRDLMVHGLWYRCVRPFADEWLVQRTRGSYVKDPAHPFAGVKRAVVPEAEIVTLSDLRAVVQRTDALIADLRRLRDSANMP